MLPSCDKHDFLTWVIEGILFYLDQRSEVEESVNDAADLAEEMLNSPNFNFAVYDEKCTQLNKALMSLYKQQGIEEIIASSLSFPVIIKFLSTLSQREFYFPRSQ